MQPAKQQQQQLSVQAQKERDRLKAQREGQLNKKEQALNKLSDEEVIVQLKAKGLGVYGTKQEKLDRLKKANGIEISNKQEQVPQQQQQQQQQQQAQQIAAQQQAQQQKGSVVDNIKKMEQQREERRKNMQEMKREKAEREEQNQILGKNVDVEFEIMIDKTRLKGGLIQEHQTTQNIKLCVCVRKRPIFKKEEVGGEIDAISCANPMIRVHEPKLKVDGITKYVENHDFQFDNTFSEVEQGKDIYDVSLAPLMDLLVNQGVVTCFAYGQTGSGKTYTMKSIQELLASDLYKLISTTPSYKIFVSFFEIYGGKCYDLLNAKAPLQIMEDKNNNIQIQGLVEKPSESEQELFQLMELANSVRTTHATVANDTSSRSHSICQIAIRQGYSDIGKLILVDLAGSERAQDTQSNNRQRRLEGAEINKSLLALKECIRAMDSGQGHVPFRASKLTLVLRDSFTAKSNKSRIIMIACISPGSSSADHSLNTLRYADRLKDKSNQAKVQLEEREVTNEELLYRQQQGQDRQSDKNLENNNKQQDKQNPPLQLPKINDPRNQNNQNAGNIKKNSSQVPEKEKPKSQPVPPKQQKKINTVQEDSDDDVAAEELVNKKNGQVKEDVRCMKETMMKNEQNNANGNGNEFFDFHEKVNTILEEQDEILNIHMAAIKEDAKLLQQESELIQSIQGVGIVDYDVDTYVGNLEAFIRKKLKIYNLLNKKLLVFKTHLKEEEEISSKMKNTFYY
ncbi:unnamed protein product (macronuclear) [Paramecium tetraurelia]|uniref:Kinesin-like protein n=1 Tax=Paramecium tetraurelia TaxID=5888 RepID=A0D7M1_PARTE|nr:uncharacterized protein GSPATT00014005001 [Paramecium tetraurelia]CAK79038.1 unnamed protein product [Paramecium tetraurelia]|eukprot:XP_001446435.1 hypothetical protein (macronuclear) [Paramecium tetraurelia strain d4-2]